MNKLKKGLVVLAVGAGMVAGGTGVASAEPSPNMPRVTYHCHFNYVALLNQVVTCHTSSI